MVDGRLLLDGGAPLLPHMKRVGVDAGAIEAVFLTHFHGDHTLGLPPFVLHRVFVDQRPLIFVGPEGIEERLETLYRICAFDRMGLATNMLDWRAAALALCPRGDIIARIDGTFDDLERALNFVFAEEALDGGTRKVLEPT